MSVLNQVMQEAVDLAVGRTNCKATFHPQRDSSTRYDVSVDAVDGEAADVSLTVEETESGGFGTATCLRRIGLSFPHTWDHHWFASDGELIS